MSFYANEPGYTPDEESADADVPADLDVDQNDLDLGHDDDSDENGTAAPGSRAAARATTNRLVRRVATKAAEVNAAPASVRGVAATLLGVNDDLVELTTAIMTGGRTTLQPVQDLTRISEADPFEAAVVAGALDNVRRKRVWALLDSLGLATGSELPASSSKAGVTVARTVHALNLDDIKDDLGDVESLLKK